jgi:hypothetical protein
VVFMSTLSNSILEKIVIAPKLPGELHPSRPFEPMHM